MLDWIIDVINALGYVGIAFLMFLENVIPPIPSEVIMPLAGFSVSEGELGLIGVIIAGTLGSVAGALPWYWLGRWLGTERLKQIVDTYGKILGLSAKDVDKSRRWFNRYGSIAVLVGRLIPGIRTYISVPAGLEEMAFVPFLIYSTLGTVLWIGFLAIAGYFLGQNYAVIATYLGPVGKVVLIALAVVTAGFLLQRALRRRSKSTKSSPRPPRSPNDAP
ncbi:MAG: DedA family protein [Cyanobacteria bacterium P01_A01_bin.135]